MRYVLTSHAQLRMQERGISAEDVEAAIQRPTAIDTHTYHRVLIRKVYYRQGQQRLLLIAGEYRDRTLRVITVIDTSKVHKYLRTYAS